MPFHHQQEDRRMSWTRLVFFLILAPILSSADSVFSTESLFSYSYSDPAKSSINTGNRVLQNATHDSLVDLRAEYKYLGESSKFIFRPRWVGEYKNWNYTDTITSDYSAKGKIDVTDAFGEWTFNENFLFSAGLIVDGWGPAEFVNPSNPFFHLNMQNKSFFYKEKGKVLSKLVWNPTAKSTIAAVVEPISNNEAPYIEGDLFFPTWIVRGEYQSDSADQTYGLLAGQEYSAATYFGEYLSFTSQSTGFSLYFEGRHTTDPQRFNPVNTAGFYNLTLQKQRGTSTYSVLGVRWEGRVDARAEWIYYDLGYSENEWKNMVTALSQLSIFITDNLKKFQRPGLEFLSKNWLSLSLRIPDLGPKSNWQLTLRALFSGGDQFGVSRAGFLQADLEVPAYESWTIFAEAKTSFGTADTELLLAANSSASIGGRWAW